MFVGSEITQHKPAPHGKPSNGCQRRSERIKNLCAINVAFATSCSRFLAIILQSTEVGITKKDSKSVAYENRTKSAKCGGLETNGPRERISTPDRCRAVRRFVREACGYWRFRRAKTQRRMLVAEELAEEKRFELAVRFWRIFLLSWGRRII